MTNERSEKDEFTTEQSAKLDEIDGWVRKLFERCGIQTVIFNADDGAKPTLGLLNVPAKYVEIFGAMHEGLAALALGEALPEITPVPPKKASKRRR